MTLQSITISPAEETITGAGATLSTLPVQFTAYGHFIHPTETVDITDSPDVTWASSAPLLADVQSYPDADPGLATASSNGACGAVVISAQAGKGVVGPGTANVVVYGEATFHVVDTDVDSCP